MTKGEQTRQTIIERAAPLFNQRGFQGCTMSDIMEATGMEKGGIYRHFSSKEEIAEESFRYSVEVTIKLRSAGAPQDVPPMATLRGLIEKFVHTPSPIKGGCPLMNTAIDADDGNEKLRALVREAFKTWRERIVATLKAATATGELADQADVDWLANTIIMMLEGAVMLSRLERRKEPLLHAQRALNLILDSVQVPRKEVRVR